MFKLKGRRGSPRVSQRKRIVDHVIKIHGANIWHFIKWMRYVLNLYLLEQSVLVWDPFAIKMIFWRILQSSEWVLILLILVELKISLEKKNGNIEAMMWYHENMHLYKNNSIKYSRFLCSKDLWNVWFWKQQQVSLPDSSAHPLWYPKVTLQHTPLYLVRYRKQKVWPCLCGNGFARLEPLGLRSWFPPEYLLPRGALPFCCDKAALGGQGIGETHLELW